VQKPFSTKHWREKCRWNQLNGNECNLEIF